MFQVLSLVVLLGLMLCILPSHKTMAQQFSASGMVYEAARNKIGLIRYCRNNGLLDPAIADQAVAAVETGLSELPPGDASAREQGDRAQRAGEDGFWEAGRRRDIASVAKLFRTTPADLCREWGNETLRAQAQARPREVTTITVAPSQRTQPLPQAEPRPAETILVKTVPAEPTPVETRLVDTIPIEPIPVKTIQVGPMQVGGPPPRTTPVVSAARSAPPPPLPEKAPTPPPTEPEPASFQGTMPTSGDLAYAGGAVSEPMSGTTALTPDATPQSSRQTAPLSARMASEAAGPLHREETVTAEAPSGRLDDQSSSSSEKWPFSCLMPGCRWPAAQERRSW
jgi:hypothetical protein